MVRAQSLDKSYDAGEIRALDGASLVIGRGEFVALMGPSGSGKSSLMQVIGAVRGSLHHAGAERRVIQGGDFVREEAEHSRVDHSFDKRLVLQSAHLQSANDSRTRRRSHWLAGSR
jgi:ABC-type lipoprotein export system ATPase subunit